MVFYAAGLRAGSARLVRGSSRRMTTMRFRPAYIRVINRRNSRSIATDVACPRLGGDTKITEGVDRSFHIRRPMIGSRTLLSPDDSSQASNCRAKAVVSPYAMHCRPRFRRSRRFFNASASAAGPVRSSRDGIGLAIRILVGACSLDARPCPSYTSVRSGTPPCVNRMTPLSTSTSLRG